MSQTVHVTIHTGGGDGKKKKEKKEKGERGMGRSGGGRMGRGTKKGPMAFGGQFMGPPQLPPIPNQPIIIPKQTDFAEQFVKALAIMGEGISQVKGQALAPQLSLNNPNNASQLAQIQHSQGFVPPRIALPSVPSTPSISGMSTLSSALAGVTTPMPPVTQTLSEENRNAIINQMSMAKPEVIASGMSTPMMTPVLSAIASQPAVSVIELPKSEAISSLSLPPLPRASPVPPPRTLVKEEKQPNGTIIYYWSDGSKTMNRAKKPVVPSLSIDA